MYQLEKMTPIKIINFGSRTCDVAVMMRFVFTMMLKILASLIKHFAAHRVFRISRSKVWGALWGSKMCDKVWQRRGSKLVKDSVTYFLDGPKAFCRPPAWGKSRDQNMGWLHLVKFRRRRGVLEGNGVKAFYFFTVIIFRPIIRGVILKKKCGDALRSGWTPGPRKVTNV